MSNDNLQTAGRFEPDIEELRRRVIENTDRHQFLGAGAGAGKTSMLVDHYFHLLEKDCAPAELMAVTFTEKAAAEMRQRLRDKCRERTRKERNLDPVQAEAWENRLYDLETAPISTIHGLCARLLRENALVAGLDPDFSVLDETESSLLLEEVVRRTLVQRLESATETAGTLVVGLGYDEAVKALVDLVGKRVDIEGILVDGVYTDSAELTRRWSTWVQERQALALQSILSHPDWVAAIEHIHSTKGPEGDSLEGLRLQLVAISDQHGLRGLRWENVSHEAYERLCQAFCDARKVHAPGNWGKAPLWRAAGADKDQMAAAQACVTRDGGSIASLIDELSDFRSDEALDQRCAELTCALVAETRAAIEAYNLAKRMQGLLDFEDLLQGARDLWGRHPEVLQQVRRRVKHLMIDEFQDTNTLQKQVLWPLVTGAPWSPETETVLPDSGPRLFVVGDAKQSIYRFRNADVTVFNSTREEMAQAGARNDELTRNFRSTPELIAVFNALFSSEKVMGLDNTEPRKATWEAGYSPMHADRGNGPVGQSPLEVHLLTIPGSHGPRDGDDDEDEGGLAAGRETEAEWLAQRLVRLLQSRETRVARKQGDETVWDSVKPGDIAILFRAMSDVSIYEKALREVQLPYYLVVGRGFYNSQEVRDVINALRALENRLDDVSLVGALRSPMFGISDETLYYLGRERRGAWWNRLRLVGKGGPILESDEESPTWEDLLGVEQFQQVRRATGILDRLQRIKNRVSLGTLIQELLDGTGLTAVLAQEKFAGDRKVANLRKLVEIAGEYEEAPGPAGRVDLRSFIEYLKLMTTREVREAQAPVEEESGNSIKLITMHSAKGLQWPVVVVPDLFRAPGGDRSRPYRWHRDFGIAVKETLDSKQGQESNYWPPAAKAIKEQDEVEEEAEERRLFYVAATRAQDLLILSGIARLKADGALRSDNAERPLGWINEACGGSLWSEKGNQPSETMWTWNAGSLALQPGCRTTEGPWTDGALADTGAREPDWEAVRRHLQSVPASARGQKRFTATELSVYAHCPAQYEKEQLRGRPAAPPKFAGAEGRERLSALEIGNVVHQVLRLVGSEGRARLDEIVPAGARVLHLDARLDHRAARVAGELRGRVQRFLDSEVYRDLFAGALRLRSEMVVTAGVEVEGETVIIEGIVDALVESPDGNLHVLDYKTGEEDTGKADQYRMQVGLYCYAIHKATGNWPASARLVYLGPAEPKTVDLVVERDAEAAAGAARAAIRGLWKGEFPGAKEEICRQCSQRRRCDLAGDGHADQDGVTPIE